MSTDPNVAPPAALPAPAADPAPTPTGGAPKLEDLQKEIAELRKEAASNRVKANQEAAAKEAAEKAKLESEGKWKELFEKERSERETLAAEAAKAKGYETVFTSEVEALKKQLGDKVPPLDGVPLAQQLPILKQIAALAAGPGAARNTTAGSPPAHHPPVDMSTMTPDQRQAHVATLSHEELRALAGASVTRSPFAMPPKR